MSYIVRFAPEAEDQLAAIERYIADHGSPVTAARYVDSIIAHCESLATFPDRGRKRDDLVPGLRITHYRGSAVIAFLVEREAEIVSIVGASYGGQDYETRLLQETE